MGLPDPERNCGGGPAGRPVALGAPCGRGAMGLPMGGRGWLPELGAPPPCGDGGEEGRGLTGAAGREGACATGAGEVDDRTVEEERATFDDGACATGAAGCSAGAGADAGAAVFLAALDFAAGAGSSGGVSRRSPS